MDPNKEYEDAFGEASGEEPVGSAAEAPAAEEPSDQDAWDEADSDEPVTTEGDEPETDEPAAEGDEPETDEPAAEGDEPETDEPAAEGDEPETDEPAAEGDEPGNEPAAEGDAPTEKPQNGIDEEQLAAAYRRLREEENKKASGGEQGSDEPSAPEETSPRDKSWQDYVPDEHKKLIEEYESEWSEVSQAEQIKRDAQLQHMQEVVYSDVRNALAPIVEEIRQSKVEAHFNAIRQVHSDFDDIREDVVGWVQEQPEFLRPAFEQVLQQGSAQQVNELVSTFKQATGKTGAAPKVPASSASKGERKPPRKPPSEAAKRAMKASPSPKRSDPPNTADPDNFEAAFDEAAKGV